VSPVVVKLGTSITATDDGELRSEVLAAICDEVARAPSAVIVTSGAIARGMRVMELPARPAAIADLPGGKRRRPGPPVPRLRRAAARARPPGRPGAAHVHDMRERTHYLNARQTLRRLLEWGAFRSSTRTTPPPPTRSPSATTTSSPRRSPSCWAPERLVLLTNTDGLYTANPTLDPSARRVEEIHDPPSSRPCRSATRRRRWARAGCARRSSPAEMATAAGIPTTICSGLQQGALGPGAGRRRRGDPLRAAGERTSSFKLWLKYAKPSHGTVVVDAGAARALREGGTSLLPVGHRRRERQLRRRRRGRRAGRRRRDRQGDRQLRGRRAAPDQGHQERRGARAHPGRGRDEAVHRDYFVLA
jgi:glutamate 5-kinase